ncbi:hypothetical protein T552_03465 [Pneumocystis carinii B80]|uniref:UspA domain-containing protein n=1 Tax=Pneumocystis carinii (strain B80) TaxID=1408658 RepID=A0A0W4ZBG1_PNEC8|nr:hypothetical protein T552_03465 [Pneumocystis carinii B80]KTW25605.1 hypothetical protein T552_03465 [Pneumocystis carinii B80]
MATTHETGVESEEPGVNEGKSNAPVFLKRVSFDTFDNRDARDFSLTLRATHRSYTYSYRSRTFLCGIDQNDYSESALDWLIEVLVEDGDEIIALRVIDPGSRMAAGLSMQEKMYRKDADRLMERILQKNEESKAISVMVEFAMGKVTTTLLHRIHIYQPDSLIIGTRGKGLGLQSLFPGSISKYCLATSPVPVIVVRPDRKREEAKSKRLANPLRQSYVEILEKSNSSMDFRALNQSAHAEKPSGTIKSHFGIFGGSKYKRLSV